MNLPHAAAKRRGLINIRESFTKCCNEMYNKVTKYTSTQQIFIGAIGYMFRPVNRSPTHVLICFN